MNKIHYRSRVEINGSKYRACVWVSYNGPVDDSQEPDFIGPWELESEAEKRLNSLRESIVNSIRAQGMQVDVNSQR